MTSSTAQNLNNEATHGGKMSLHLQVPIAVTISIAVIVGVVSNLLVVLSYCRDYRLKTVHNLYILNLTISDLVVASVCMPGQFVIYVLGFWAPVMIAMSVHLACVECVDASVLVVLRWLVWLKACADPFIYALNSPLFRYNFKDLLATNRCWKRPAGR
nr:hypothetical protein BaRGS_007604 [Batillaria attramentaria]